MNVTEAKRKLEELKTAVLADGKVDLTEVNVLLDFVEGYIDNKKFRAFKQTLLSAKADGKITAEESDEIVKEIKFLSRFLTVSTFIERGVVIGVALAIAAMAIGELCFK